MGPRSYIWEGFVDPVTRKAVYSIELARVSLYGQGFPSNITFGDANDADYANMPSLKSSASLLDYSYPVSNFSFGTVYQTDGVDSSEFFYNMEEGPNAIFTTNFKGLGLPANLYSQFVSLFEFVTKDEVVCDNTLDGICKLPGKCSEFVAYEDFTFKVNFTGTHNYMRIPMAAFAEENLVGGGNSICNIYVTYLDTMNAQSTNIIFGGMFFSEFFGVFINDYAEVFDPMQDITLYVGRNA